MSVSGSGRGRGDEDGSAETAPSRIGFATRRLCQQQTLCVTKKHVKKFEKLKPKKTNTQPEQDICKTVIDLSTLQLSQEQTKVLAKGLNFAVAPTRIPKEEVITQVECAIRRLPIEEAEEIRHKTCRIIQKAKPPARNITKEERKASGHRSLQETKPRREFYEQASGAAMGSPLSPVIVNIFMEAFEHEAIESSRMKPKYWYRYLDTFVIWPHGPRTLEEFLQHINRQHANVNFTMEIEEDGNLPFLDAKPNGYGSAKRNRCGIYNKKKETTTPVFRNLLKKLTA
ncbi:hypothetical protein Trydic_g6826 [Trypoxylus dichotomus]